MTHLKIRREDINAKSDTKGELYLKPICLFGSVSAGIDISLSKMTQIAIAVQYNRSLSSISDYSSDYDYKLSSQVDEINSIMGSCDNVSAQFIGIDITFRYYIK